MVYEILYSDDFLKLSKQVNEKFDEGWVCLGGISCDDTRYLQSMTNDTLDKAKFMQELDDKLKPRK